MRRSRRATARRDIGDHACRDAQQGCPRGIGERTDDDVAGPDAAEVGRTLHDARGSGDGSETSGRAGQPSGGVDRQLGWVRRGRGDRPGLEDPEVVLGRRPLHVLWRLQGGGDLPAQIVEPADGGVVDAGAAPAVLGHRRPEESCPDAVESGPLVPDAHGHRSGRVHTVGVRGDRALDHAGAEAPRGLDLGGACGAGRGEHDPRDVGVHEALDEHGHGEVAEGSACAQHVAAGRGPGRVERTPGRQDRIGHLRHPVHGERAAVLPRARGARDVLVVRGRSHGDWRVAEVLQALRECRQQTAGERSRIPVTGGGRQRVEGDDEAVGHRQTPAEQCAEGACLRAARARDRITEGDDHPRPSTEY